MSAGSRLGAFVVTRDGARLLPPVVECLRAVADEVLVVADARSVDGSLEMARDLEVRAVEMVLHGSSYESTLNAIVRDWLDTDWVFWLHDDELVGPAFAQALPSLMNFDRAWRFPHFNLWPDARHYVATPPLYDDLQLRLVPRRMWLDMGGWTEHIHASPAWPCRVAPCHIWHYKFLVKSLEERERRLASWVDEYPAAGNEHYRAFSIVEKTGGRGAGRPALCVADTAPIEPAPEMEYERLLGERLEGEILGGETCLS